MIRGEVDQYFQNISAIESHANRFAPITMRGVLEFRAELGGLLTVAIASSYENAVKGVLIDYSSRHHHEFGAFVERNFEKLNSKVSIGDLYRYAEVAGPVVSSAFKQKHKRYKALCLRFARVNIDESYKQILRWRHAYAHAGQKSTSLEEAFRKHEEAKRILYGFASAFERGCP